MNICVCECMCSNECALCICSVFDFFLEENIYFQRKQTCLINALFFTYRAHFWRWLLTGNSDFITNFLIKNTSYFSAESCLCKLLSHFIVWCRDIPLSSVSNKLSPDTTWGLLSVAYGKQMQNLWCFPP